MHGSPELTAALIACVALLLGAATRLLSRRFGFPYTVGMMLLGVAAGLALTHTDSESPIVESFRAAAAVSPDLILFVFLPALVFESAFDIDVHAFRKDLGAIAVLALPALLVAGGLTAAGAVYATDVINGWTWSWPAALVFGALISATDPVAVVALLRDVGAPHRLGLLIEGESLFNDGTAIVVFTVLLGLLTGTAADPELGHILLRFGWVVTGGAGVGLLLAALLANWIGRTFNDAMVEITLTIVLAYAAMIVGEGLLHVSGVIAVVLAGLFMAGPGRTRITPEVFGFLHRFWGMLAYAANTLIFFLVGVVIAVHVDEAALADVALVLALFALIVAVRFAVTFAFRPLMRLVADPISKGEVTVMAWGGLRGAVSLALALAVGTHPDVPREVGAQILRVTAGVVLLTILVNGTTTAWLLRRLGFDRPQLADVLVAQKASLAALDQVEERLTAIAREPGLGALPWAPRRHELEERRSLVHKALDDAHESLAHADVDIRLRGEWRQALAAEHEAYWRAFAAGTLGASATRILSHEVQFHHDRLEEGDLTPPRSRLPEREGLRARLARLLRHFGMDLLGIRFDRLALLYDLYRAQDAAARAVLSAMAPLVDDAHPIMNTYRRFAREARERLEDLRVNLPEVVRAVEDKLAQRIELNLERDAYREQKARGVLAADAADEALGDIEERIKALRHRAHALKLPETAEVCRNSAIFADLSKGAREELVDITRELVLAAGEILFEAGEAGDSMCVLVRGAAHVLESGAGGEETVIEVLGSGDMVGEMALLTGEPRAATVRAATTLTLGQIRRADFERLLESETGLRAEVDRAFVARRFDNHLRRAGTLPHLSHADRLRWIAAARMSDLPPQTPLAPAKDERYCFLVSGAVEDEGEVTRAPALLEPSATAITTSKARVAYLAEAASAEGG